MKTTVDLPEHLLRRAKAEAALAGLKLRALVAQALQLRLGIKPIEPDSHSFRISDFDFRIFNYLPPPFQ